MDDWRDNRLCIRVSGGIEVFAVEFIMCFIDSVKNAVLMCGVVTFVAAIAMIIVGCIVHTVRKKRLRRLEQL